MSIARVSSQIALIAISFLSIGCGDDGPSDPGGNGGGGNVTLNVTVEGGSSVQFFNNQNVLHKCGDPTFQTSATQCTATLPANFPVTIQRTLSLPTEEEARWRLAEWEGACAGIDVPNAPRGGQCQITMNSNKNVFVNFEQRVRVQVNHTSSDPMSIRWDAAFSQQKSGGNPLTRGGVFDCNFPSGLPVCSIDAMYDSGTTLTLNVGTGPAVPANWQGWGGACASAGQSRTCVLTLASDVTVTGNWAFD